MKNQLSDIYEQILLNEAEKHNLQNISSDEVGKLPKINAFDSTPKPVEGPDKAKLVQGPSYKETTGSAVSTPKASKSSFKGSAPAKETKVEKGEEMEDTKVDPIKEEEEDKDEQEPEKKKSEIKKESFTMSAFETLFKKTLTEEVEETPTTPEMETEEELDLDEENETLDEEATEEELEEEESDLISDLRELQDKLESILSKLEDVAEQEEELESEEEYTEEEFDSEFGEGEEKEEETAVKESMDKPKPLNSSKGKALMSKKNKVGRLCAKGGKANGGSVKNEPKPKALGDKKSSLQKGKNEVKSSVKKGDFFK